MEIHALKLVVSEEGVNALLNEYLPDDFTVEDLSVRIAPDGLHVQGVYPTVFIKVPFETHWAIKIVEGHIHAQLVTIKVSGVPGTMFRKLVLDMIAEIMEREPGIALLEETVRIDLESVAHSKKLKLRCNLRAVYCEAGHLLLEAGRD
jgi:hypothetical protein